jgi:hypothetical protein
MPKNEYDGITQKQQKTLLGVQLDVQMDVQKAVNKRF